MDEAREASERMIHPATLENVCVCVRQHSIPIFLSRRQGIQMGWRIKLWQATAIFRNPWVIFPHKDTVLCHCYAMQYTNHVYWNKNLPKILIIKNTYTYLAARCKQFCAYYLFCGNFNFSTTSFYYKKYISNAYIRTAWTVIFATVLLF